jgi:hypothetical protein
MWLGFISLRYKLPRTDITVGCIALNVFVNVCTVIPESVSVLSSRDML